MVINELQWFWTHRLPLAQHARAHGWTVEVASPPSAYAPRVVAAGFPVHAVLRARHDNSPLGQLRNVAALIALYRDLRPTIVHHVTLKPVLFGSIAARVARVPAVVNAIAGLGFIFMSEAPRARLTRRVALPLLRAALSLPRQLVVFQNVDDRRVFVQLGLVRESETIIIRGAGVDTAAFPLSPMPAGVPVAMLPARMLRDKGVEEFAEAARILAARGVACRLVLCGEPDPANPTSVSEGKLQEWRRAGILEYRGHVEDMAAEIARASMVVLPSYREGLPKALLEGASMGRPLITTDVPGCREVVQQGLNGLLVPVRDAVALANAIEYLAGDRSARERMGAAGRALVLREFSQERVAAETLAGYERLADEASA